MIDQVHIADQVNKQLVFEDTISLDHLRKEQRDVIIKQDKRPKAKEPIEFLVA